MLTLLARNGSIYILRTDLTTAEKIAELTAAGGQFTLVLRPDEDDRVANTTGSTLDMLLDEFGFPIPGQPGAGGAASSQLSSRDEAVRAPAPATWRASGLGFHERDQPSDPAGSTERAMSRGPARPGEWSWSATPIRR